ncbi:hypothetical protein [Pseudonocardia sp. NPDC049635]
MNWACICLAGAAAGAVAAFLGLRRSWRALGEHAAEHAEVLRTHEQHTER